MRKLLIKELKLSTNPITYLFIAFGLMFFIPGYPILCGVFFTTLGIFQNFQFIRESNDILFSSLLPIAKADVVKGKYLFVCFIEICSAMLMLIAVITRMTLFANSEVYRNNAMMNANFFALGVAFVIFSLFNLIFVAGFFKTAYKFARPFIIYIVVAFLCIGIAEALHHIPIFSQVNAFGMDNIIFQVLSCIIGILIYIIITYVSYRISCKRFEKIDL